MGGSIESIAPPPPYAWGGVYYNDKISRLNICTSLPYVEETYIFTILSYFNLELHILTFDDILRKLLSI